MKLTEKEKGDLVQGRADFVAECARMVRVCSPHDVKVLKSRINSLKSAVVNLESLLEEIK